MDNSFKAHLEAAVAADDNDVALAESELRAYRGGDRVAHRAHSARREEASLTDSEIVGAPDLVLTYIGAENSLSLEHRAQFADKSSRLHITLEARDLALEVSL